MNNLIANERNSILLPDSINEDPFPTDILDRQKLVEQILNLIITLSNSNSFCSFALNGKWGSGKTFILNILERQLRDYQAGERFIVFHYNCWKYDYYEEPLISIVSAMLDNLDEYALIFSNEVRNEIQSGLISTAKQVIKKIACSFVEKKIGIDADDFSDLLGTVQNEMAEKLDDMRSYDDYYTFNKAIENAKKELSKLTEYQTLVIVVDELDRCLPNYAIKILERLHHLFSDLQSTVLVMALDKVQMENAIRQIFGDTTDCNAYLKKCGYPF